MTTMMVIIIIHVDDISIMVHSKASWTGLICRTHQHCHRQWLPNNEWSNSILLSSAFYSATQPIIWL